MQPRDAVPAPGRAAAECAAIAALATALAAISWRRWPDLLIDFGQQLYIPWRLALGERLHRDILFLHGPLSQHLNACLFRVFGVSLTVLVAANLAIAAAMAFILHRAVNAAADRATAFVAALSFTGLFAFAQYVMTGNYNFVCPYTHEATHGSLLAAAMLLPLARLVRQPRARDGALAGLCCGLALLTKSEISLAVLGTALVAFAVLAIGPHPLSSKAAGALAFGGAAVLPGAGFFLYFLRDLPAAAALRAAASGVLIVPGEVSANPFYRHVLGIDNTGGNLVAMLVALLWVAGLVTAGVAAGLLANRWSGESPLFAIAGGCALFGLLVLGPGLLPWAEMPRALPPLTAILTGVFLSLVLRDQARGEVSSQRVMMLLLSVLGCAMTAKAALNLHLFHYGFYLALPATMAVLAAALYWVPQALRACGRPGDLFRALATGFILAMVVYHVRWSHAIDSLKDLSVGQGGDVIVTFGGTVQKSGPITAEALHWIDANMPGEATFVALPEGIMINYLARRASSVPFANFSLGELNRFGEARLLLSLAARPPDYVLLVDRRSEETGLGPFGDDERYGRRTVAWVEERYETAAQFGARPLKKEGFGIRILKRRSGDLTGQEGAR